MYYIDWVVEAYILFQDNELIGPNNFIIVKHPEKEEKLGYILRAMILSSVMEG